MPLSDPTFLLHHVPNRARIASLFALLLSLGSAHCSTSATRCAPGRTLDPTQTRCVETDAATTDASDVATDIQQPDVQQPDVQQPDVQDVVPADDVQRDDVQPGMDVVDAAMPMDATDVVTADTADVVTMDTQDVTDTVDVPLGTDVRDVPVPTDMPVFDVPTMTCAGGWSSVVCYVDSDGDDYGIGAPMAVCPTTMFGGCPTGFSRRGGDCCDRDFNANPGSSYGSPNPRAVCLGWDYNCSGSDDLVNTFVAAGTTLCGTFTDEISCGDATTTGGVRAGWIGSVPACGVTASYFDGCIWEPTRMVCRSISVGAMRQQECR